MKCNMVSDVILDSLTMVTCHVITHIPRQIMLDMSGVKGRIQISHLLEIKHKRSVYYKPDFWDKATKLYTSLSELSKSSYKAH